MITISSRFFWLLGASAVALGIGKFAVFLPTTTKPVSLLGEQNEESER